MRLSTTATLIAMFLIATGVVCLVLAGAPHISECPTHERAGSMFS